MSEIFTDYNNFKRFIVSSKVDIYKAQEIADGELPANKPIKRSATDAVITAYRDKADPRKFNRFNISETGKNLVSIIEAKKENGGVAPGVDYVKIYTGYVDNNYNGKVDSGEPKVTILTYYPSLVGTNGDVEQQPLEGIRVIKQ